MKVLTTRRLRITAACVGTLGLVGGSALAAGGTALAQTAPCTTGTTQCQQATGTTTQATATIAQSTTLTDNTASINFGSPSVLGQENPSNTPVSLTVTTNDASGWATTAVAQNAGTGVGNENIQDSQTWGLWTGTGQPYIGGGTGTNPATAISFSALQVQGTQGLTGVTGSAFEGPSASYCPGDSNPSLCAGGVAHNVYGAIDTGAASTAGTGQFSLSNQWELNVPTTQSPGTYTATLTYYIAPN